jgi:hypothetical protein
MGVVADCCFDRTQASHFINLYDMHQKYGDVLTSGGAIEYFRSIGEAGQAARLDAAAGAVVSAPATGMTVGAASS